MILGKSATRLNQNILFCSFAIFCTAAKKKHLKKCAVHVLLE